MSIVHLSIYLRHFQYFFITATKPFSAKASLGMDVQAYLNEVKLHYYSIGKMIIGKILKINYTRKVPTCFETSSGSDFLFNYDL